MANAQKIELRQSQSLVLTPQLQQSLKILQYSTQELLTYIESELEKNPLLSKDDGLTQEQGTSDRDNTGTESDTVPEQDFATAQEVLDISHENDWDTKENEQPQQDLSYEGSGLSQNITSGQSRIDFDDSATSIEQNISGNKTLREHLYDQISVEFNSITERVIASHLIDLIDDSGYLTSDTKSLESLLDCTGEEIDAVLKKCHGLDPSGVFARNLNECLALQLAERNRLDPAMKALVENLTLCADGNLRKLEKICGVDREDIIEMIYEIKTLNPKPGSDFEVDIVQTMIPDIFVRKNPYKKGWLVELNNEALPRILVNKKYYSEIKTKVIGENDKKYLSEQIGAANWLLKTLNQRAETILKVATELVSQQDDFFERGIKYLKPMILKDIASQINVHESTVGRVTSNKFMATPRGTYELKFFFSSSLNDSTGITELSSRSVKYRIKELVAQENNKTILSDEKLVKILNGEGIDIARRTVTKYREAMSIPSSSLRRKQKRLELIK